MKNVRFFVFLLLCVSLSVPTGPNDFQNSDQQRLAQNSVQSGVPKTALSFAEIPLYFIPNAGQFDARASYCARTSSYTLWATNEGLLFDCAWEAGAAKARDDGQGRFSRPRPTKCQAIAKRDVSRLVFPGRNEAVKIVPGALSPHRVNYFLGNDPARWREGVETYAGILYEELYPEIDLKVYGVERAIEYDWIIKPGGDLRNIRFEYRDVKGTRIDAEGNLLVATSFGEIVHRKPVGYQTAAGGRDAVDVRFKRLDADAYGFEAGPYDQGRALVIDPVVLVYSTFLGGNGWDRCGGIAVDKNGCVYVAGQTYSTNFPTKSAYDPGYNGGSGDVFVAKFNASGKGLVYSTFLGGPNREAAYCLTVDASESAYLGGFANDGFPTKNAYDNDYDDSKHGDYFDAIVVKLNALGQLAYSTYLGKGDDDVVYAIAVDGAGRAHVGGQTDNADFPLKYAFQTHYGDHDDAFIAVFSASGNSLETSTFLGGNYPDTVRALVLDEKGYVYIAGETWSADFPTKNAFDSTFNGRADAFYAKLGPRARSCVFATYLGGSQVEYGYGIAVDDLHGAYLTGQTSSPNFPKASAYDKTLGGGDDAFVAKFSPNGKRLVYSTFIGGTDRDWGSQIALDAGRNAYVAGQTESTDFPCLNAHDDVFNGVTDAFVLKLAPTGKTLAFSTLLGGSSFDEAMALCLDSSGAVYIAGETRSSNFPVYKGYDMGFNGGEYDVFVAKLK